MKFLIRTNYNTSSGAGHYMRCIRLANEIRKKNKNIIIILDKKIQNYYYDKNTKHVFLYKNKNFTNEYNDAQKVKKLIKKKDYLIVDDYRLGKKWEITIKKKVKKLIVIDDFINRKHACDYYINFRELDNQEVKKLEQNLPKIAKKLIGHKYSIINPKIKNLKKKNNRKKKILFYTGNTGNPLIFYKLIQSLLKESIDKKKSLEINLFLGNKKFNLKKFIKLKKKYNFFKIINNKFNLEKYLIDADLFFGFSGNLIYENSFLNLFSFFFPSSENQKNNLENMEILGHYLFFKKKDLKETIKLTNLTFKVLRVINKLKKICFRNSRVSKDGAKKILSEILKNKNIKKNIRENSYKKESPLFKIKKINFTDVNNFFILRNKKLNRENMIDKKKINLLDHYNWWLGDENKMRKSYQFNINKNLKIFIWHKIISVSKKYLVGGWFSSGRNVPLNYKIAAVKWQIKKTKKYKIKWIGVIKKKNISTLKLNLMVGFKIMKKNSIIYKDTLNVFNISPKKYYLVYY